MEAEEAVGTRIRWVVEKHLGTTQTEFARRMGIRQPQLSRWINDPSRPPSEASLQAIAETGGVSVAWLRYGVGNPVEPGEPEESVEEAVSTSAEVDLFEDLDRIVRYMRKMGPPGSAERRKRAALMGLKEMLAATGGVPEWWYELRDRLEAGEL